MLRVLSTITILALLIPAYSYAQDDQCERVINANLRSAEYQFSTRNYSKFSEDMARARTFFAAGSDICKDRTYNELQRLEKMESDRLIQNQEEEIRLAPIRKAEEAKRLAEHEELKGKINLCIKRNKISKGEIRLGMTAGDVILCGWGEPRDINRSVGAWGVHEQWVYGGGNYLYFENGKLRSFQN